MRSMSHHSHSLDKNIIHTLRFYWPLFPSRGFHIYIPFSPNHFQSRRKGHTKTLDSLCFISMAATMATTMAMLNAKCMAANTPKMIKPTSVSKLPTSLLSLQNLPKGLTSTSSLAGTALAGAVFSTLSSCDPAMAVQQIAEIAAESGSGDNRGLALLLPIIPAIAWVLFNIFQPALNQLSRMRETRGVIAGLGIGGGLAALGLASAPEASAGEIAAIAEAVANDNRGQLLLVVITPAVLWVLYNILQPALNQLNRMRSE